jgi:hypothetical protein
MLQAAFVAGDSVIIRLMGIQIEILVVFDGIRGRRVTYVAPTSI